MGAGSSHNYTHTHKYTHKKKVRSAVHAHMYPHTQASPFGHHKSGPTLKSLEQFLLLFFFFFFFKHPVYIYDLTVMTDLPNSSTIYDALTTCAYVGLGLYPCLPPYLVSICVTLFKRLSYPTVILRKKVNV